MGINKSLVVIEGVHTCSIVDLIESFGFRDVIQLRQSILSEHIYPTEQFLAVSYCNDFTIIAHDTLPLSMIQSDFARRCYSYENAIGQHFKNQNYLAVLLESDDNTYAMRLRKDGRDFQIYGRAGSSVFKYGEMTPIEIEYFNKSFIKNEGDLWAQRIFLVDGQEFSHDQIGENIVLRNLQQFIQVPVGLLYELTTELFSVKDEHLYYHP